MNQPNFTQPFQDKSLVCIDCGQVFVFTAGEQEYFSQRALSPVKRCAACRELRRSRISREVRQ